MGQSYPIRIIPYLRLIYKKSRVVQVSSVYVRRTDVVVLVRSHDNRRRVGKLDCRSFSTRFELGVEILGAVDSPDSGLLTLEAWSKTSRAWTTTTTTINLVLSNAEAVSAPSSFPLPICFLRGNSVFTTLCTFRDLAQER